MSGIRPISDHHEQKGQHSSQHDSKKEESFEEVKKPLYTPVGPRGNDSYQSGDPDLHHIRYGYGQAKNLQNQILKHQHKKPPPPPKIKDPLF